MKRPKRLLVFVMALACAMFAFAGCTDPSGDENTDMENTVLNIKIGDTTLTATLVDNSSAEALVAELKKSPITLEMHDYAGFEKVGALGVTLPRNDKQIATSAGDLILYQGNQFVIYYGTNNWSLTRLGKIDNLTRSELMSVLGDGNVTVTLSLA